jgi:hypothetical protein
MSALRRGTGTKMPTLKRSTAQSNDSTDKLVKKLTKYAHRLILSMSCWEDQREAVKIRRKMRALFAEPTKEETESESEDDGIDLANVVYHTRQRRKPDYYKDEEYDELILEDVPDEEITAALKEEVSDYDCGDEDEDEEWTIEDE